MAGVHREGRSVEAVAHRAAETATLMGRHGDGRPVHIYLRRRSSFETIAAPKDEDPSLMEKRLQAVSNHKGGNMG
jgi:hypothetical protein